MKKQNTLQKPMRNDIILILVLLISAILFLVCYYLFFHKDGAFMGAMHAVRRSPPKIAISYFVISNLQIFKQTLNKAVR